MRKLLNLLEDPQLKKEIINVVKATDDLSVLHKVLNTLKAGNIDERIKSVIGKDGDAQQFIKQIVSTILEVEAPIEEKNAFLDQYAKGKVINTKLLLDGKLHSFGELVGTRFASEVFKKLSVDLVSQGVGPGEVALAVLSPEIQWSGRTSGGGDIQVKKKPVEVKTRVSKGGRWINARKAKLDLGGIVTAISKNLISKVTIPDRINANYWVDTLRPAINPKALKKVAESIADCTFKFANNASYKKALVSGDASNIVNTFIDVGYNNYKEYSGFVGMLLMDVPTEQLQYFEDYSQMHGTISVGTTYILAPESEMMPQIILDPGAGEVRAGRSASDKAAIAAAKANPVAIPDPKNSYTKAQLSKEFYAYVNNVAAQRGIMDLPLADQKYFVNELISLHTRGVSTSEIKKRFVTDLLDYKAKNNLREHSVSPMRQRRT